MAAPLFPSLLPRVADSAWFSVDRPCDDDSELTKLEEEQQALVITIGSCTKALDFEKDTHIWEGSTNFV